MEHQSLIKTKHLILSGLILGSASAFAGTASSPSEPITPAAPSSEWNVNMTLYGWMQGLNGDIGIITLHASDDKAWVDPIIGALFKAELPHHFFFTALGDVGGFDVSSQFTWQAMGGFGYHINSNSSVMLGYRAIGTDYTNGGFTYDITASGAMLAYAYKF